MPWRCSLCGCNNTDSSNLCSNCGTAKPYGSGGPGGGAAASGGAASLVAASSGANGAPQFPGLGQSSNPLGGLSANSAGLPPQGGGGAAASSPASMRGASPLTGVAVNNSSPSMSAAAKAGGGAGTVGGAEQLTYLHSVVDQSKRFGQDIERSVEELAQLLHKKTVECEGLRAIASENYSGLREAVRNEYENRLKSESRQHQELRTMQSKVDNLQAERNQLLAEVESLREVVAKMEKLPPHAPYSPNDNSMFNRIMRQTGDGNGDPVLGSGGEDGNPAGMMKSVNTWQLANKDHVPQGAQRELINYVNNLDHEHAKALHASGTFDFMKSCMQRLCTPLPNGTFPDLPTVVGKLLRERRDDPQNFAHESQLPIPEVSKDAYSQAAEVFLLDNPGQHAELQRQMELYRGREHELYAQIHRDHAAKQGFQKDLIQQGSAGAEGALAGKVDPSSTSSGQDANLELEARVVLMYRMYNPSKLNGKELNELLSKYPPEVLLSALIEKYGPEPSAAERRTLIKGMVSE